jgi:hypothetical protein
MKNDINIEEFTPEKNIKLTNGQSQRAINWLNIKGSSYFSKFGVDWNKFILNETTNISLLALQQYATQELSKNGMNFKVVNLDLTDPSAPIFNIKEIS